jgi:HlyD family secretion protein
MKRKNKLMLPIAIVLLVLIIVFLVVGKKAGWMGSDITVSVWYRKLNRVPSPNRLRPTERFNPKQKLR